MYDNEEGLQTWKCWMMRSRGRAECGANRFKVSLRRGKAVAFGGASEYLLTRAADFIQQLEEEERDKRRVVLSLLVQLLLDACRSIGVVGRVTAACVTPRLMLHALSSAQIRALVSHTCRPHPGGINVTANNNLQTLSRHLRTATTFSFWIAQHST